MRDKLRTRKPKDNGALVQNGQSSASLPAPPIIRLLTRQNFADALNLCVHSIARMERDGKIKGYRLNARVVRYPVSELERLLAEAR